MSGRPALLSIHDLMPETMDRVIAMMDRFEGWGIGPVSLLVVPGKDWGRGHLEQIRNWSEKGHPLVAHGWAHWTEVVGIRHRLHSMFFSRTVAEHLALDREGVMGLMRRSYAWFGENGFPDPGVYVPPAWALGAVGPSDLAELPYDQVEATEGVYFRQGEGMGRCFLPVVGFEADTAMRAAFLKPWNRVQVRQALRKRVPLRIALHPFDDELRLAGQMGEILAMGWDWCRYGDVLEAE